MENKEHIDYEELLVRYLQDTADSRSLQQLLEIVRKSEDKKQELARMKTIYDSLSVQVATRKYPIEASWERMRQRIGTGKQAGASCKRIIPLWSYAAIFLLALSLGIQYLYYRNNGWSQDKGDNYTRFVVEKGGGKSSLFLPDGTKVLLNAGTTIQYPTQFDRKERIVMLDGEGFFEVAENKQKPFIVRLKGYDVKVLGTVFNVKAYPEMAYSTTSLISGKVILTSYSPDGSIQAEQILHPDETARVDIQTGTITTFRSNDEFQLSWTKGLYKFKDKTFAEIMSELELLYDVTIQIEDEALAKSVYTGSIVLKNTIEEVLKPLGIYNEFRYKKEGHIIRIYSKK